jgi:hypothetical protein
VALQNSPFATLLVLEGYNLTLDSSIPYDACLLNRSAVRAAVTSLGFKNRQHDVCSLAMSSLPWTLKVAWCSFLWFYCARTPGHG